MAGLPLPSIQTVTAKVQLSQSSVLGNIFLEDIQVSHGAPVVDITTIQQPFSSHWLTSLVGSHKSYIKQESIVIGEDILSTAALPMDQHLEQDTIFTLPTTLHQTPTHTQTLDASTARHLATAMDPPSHNHSWRVVATSDLTKSKSSMKLPEEIVQLAVLVLHTLFSKIKPLQIYKGKYKLLVNYRCTISENSTISDNIFNQNIIVQILPVLSVRQTVVALFCCFFILLYGSVL